MTRSHIVEALIIIAAMALLVIACLRLDASDAMAKCQTLHSFDTCHHALNR